MGTKIRKCDLKQLINFIESKHVAVPEFQRGFVWKTGQVKKLFDSLVKQYPVGSFILWETNKRIDARTLDGEKLPQKRFLILDGQQRMASIYYLCRQKKFVAPHIKDKFHETCDNRERHIIDFEKFYIDKTNKEPALEYARESYCKFDFNRFSHLVRKSYRFPVITISLNNYRHAIEVFERINQAGTRISTESIFLSETWNQHSNIGKILRTYKRQKDESLTKGIDTVIFIHVFAIILQLENREQKTGIEIGIKILKKIAEEVHQHTKNKYSKIFENAVDSVARTVTYLKEEYGIISLSELPSQTMITVLSIFFYYQKRAISNKQALELRKWFWRSSLSNRYIGSGYSQNIGSDAEKMRDLAKCNRGLKIPKVTKIFAKIKDVDLRAGRSTYRNIIKQALWQQNPIFINGNRVSRNDVESGQHKPEDDHFFPYDFYRKGIAGQEINNILNIHFLNKNENGNKGGRWPSEWLQNRIQDIGASAGMVKKYFESQLLPFKTLRELRRYERASKNKRIKAKQKEFATSYQKFLRRRFKLFKNKLDRLQAGYN